MMAEVFLTEVCITLVYFIIKPPALCRLLGQAVASGLWRL